MPVTGVTTQPILPTPWRRCFELLLAVLALSMEESG